MFVRRLKNLAIGGYWVPFNLIGFGVLAWFASKTLFFDWELYLARLVQEVAFPGFHQLMVAVSFPGNGVYSWVLACTAGFVLILMHFGREGVVLMTGVGIGGWVNALLKSWIARPRPTEDVLTIWFQHSNESFPSGHVMFYTEFLGFLIFLAILLVQNERMKRGVALTLGALIILVGVSRVYLGAHWPGDVIGAYLLGSVWLFFMIFAYRRLPGSHP